MTRNQFQTRDLIAVADHDRAQALARACDVVARALKFESRLVAVSGPAREATFVMKGPDGGLQEVTRRFDLLHVCPPQTAPDFVRSSPLAGDAGWIDVVAENVLAALDSKEPRAIYDGYGSCALTVECGRIVLAEFGYGGKLLPAFPKWLIDGTRPSRLAWLLKERILPPVYWRGMLKGREWLCAPQVSPPDTPEVAA